MIAIEHPTRSSQRHLVRLPAYGRQKSKNMSVGNFLLLLVLAVVSWLVIAALIMSLA